MLFSDALFNIFAGVFDVLNDVRQNVAVVLLSLYSIIPNLDAIIRVRMLCQSSMLLFVFRIMFVLIRVFRELDRYRPLQKRERAGKEYGCFPFV